MHTCRLTEDDGATAVRKDLRIYSILELLEPLVKKFWYDLRKTEYQDDNARDDKCTDSWRLLNWTVDQEAPSQVCGQIRCSNEEACTAEK